jgi:hypothetical protein
MQRGHWIEEQPNQGLVYAVKFSLGATVCLTAIEITNLVLLQCWNSEVFAAITGLIGTVTGIFVGQKS